jgi:hypothetical protein
LGVPAKRYLPRITIRKARIRLPRLVAALVLGLFVSTVASAQTAKPTLKDFPLEKFRDEDDPYAAQSAALTEALVRWIMNQRIDATDAAAKEARRSRRASAHWKMAPKTSTGSRPPSIA